MSRFCTAFLMSLLLLVPSARAENHCQRPFSVGWESWEPYMFRDDNGELTGLDIELLQAVFKEMGCTLRYVEMPFKRHLLQLEKGQVDLATSVQIRPDRELYAIFSAPYRNSEMNLYLRTENVTLFPEKSLEDMLSRGVRIGVVRGYYYGETVRELLANEKTAAQFEEETSDTLNVRKVLGYRINGLLADPIVITHELRKNGNTGALSRHPVPVHSAAFYFMFSRKSVKPEFIEAFNDALGRTAQSGVLATIIDKYQQQ